MRGKTILVVAVVLATTVNVWTTVTGEIVAWGQGGIGSGNVVSTVPAGTDYVAIAAGHHHSSALKDDGSIVSWGTDSFSNVVSDTHLEQVLWQ